MKKKWLYFIIGLLCGIIIAIISFVAGMKIFYPVAYKKEILKYSKQYDLEPSLVFAVINTESRFNAVSVSRVGAKGLMQIMPSTAEWICDELDIPYTDSDLLFNPEINILLGCFYLNYLSSKYENLNKVLFSYNAGEGVMANFYDIDEPLVIETIEIKETKRYIEKVIQNKKVYEKYEAFFLW